MCIKLKGSGMTPGQIQAFMTKLGKASGIWGFNNGTQYNARLESLDTTWGKYKDNKGILTVDSFWERGKQFVRRDGKLLQIGIIYNDKPEFAVVTMNANDVVKPFHHRMPVVLTEDSARDWMNGDILAKVLDQREIVLLDAA